MRTGPRHSGPSVPRSARAGTWCSKHGAQNAGRGKNGRPTPGPSCLTFPGRGRVEQRREITSIRPPFISFRNTYTFLAGGAVITSDSTLRFRSRDELESSLATQGYRVLDVREAPDRPGHEFVFITERTT